MSKVLLLKAPGFVSFPFPRLGLASLAAHLMENDIEVDVIDCDAIHYKFLKENKNKIFSMKTRNIGDEIDWDNLTAHILQNNYSVVGISCIFSADINNTIKLAAIVQEKMPDAIIVGGGHHMDAEASNILAENSNFDCIVFGEGEESLHEIVKRKNEKSINSANKDVILDGVQGIIYRTSDGQIITNQERKIKVNINDRPIPAREKLPLDIYSEYFEDTDFHWALKDPDTPCGILITSRGCPYKCTYCSATSFWGHRVQLRSADNIIKEIEFLEEKYNVKHFSIVDSTFLVSKKRVMDFCQKKIEKNMTFTWLCNGRVDTIDARLVESMKKAGCTTIGFGVETGSDAIAETMKKKSSKDVVRRAVRLVKEAGILPICYFMIGYIGETKETLAETKDFMKELIFEYGAYVDSPFIATPFPGTEFYDIAKSQNKITTFDFENYWLGKRFRSPGILPYVPDSFNDQEIISELKAFHLQLIDWRTEMGLEVSIDA